MFMKRFLISTILALTLALPSLGEVFTVPKAHAIVRVRGYYKKSGTYVAPHYRSNPDGYRYNNYGSYYNRGW